MTDQQNSTPTLSDLSCSVDVPRRFGSLERVFGARVLQTLADAHVVVAGVGGVGSWAAEALARSAVGQITLIDLDHVAESNINRQVHALESTLGQSKIEAMAQRIAQINPLCQVHLVDDFVTPDNLDAVVPSQADLVLDCTDQLQAKLALVLQAKRRTQGLLVCGAAGGKVNGLALRRTDLRDAQQDPLLAKMRQQLRKHHGFPPATGKRVLPMGVQALWIDEPVRRPENLGAAGGALACAGYGSLVTVTASMGLAAAAWAMERLVSAHQE